MKENLTESETSAILKALDDALEKGPWEESNFLRVIGKNLQGIRNNLATEIEKNAMGTPLLSSRSDSREVERSGQREVYISLYSATGSQLLSWERIISNLPGQMISRPIYADEKDIEFLIKSKENKFNEAYVVIYINESDVLKLSTDKTPQDKFGKPLLAIKDRALILENITRFVHISGSYKYEKGHLTRSG